MFVDHNHAAAAHVLAIYPGQDSPEDMLTKLSAFLKSVCDAETAPTDGLSKSQGSLIWQRQIALQIAARAYGMSSDQADMIQTLIEAERTVWDDRELDRLADLLTSQAAMVADEWRGEAEVLRGEI